MDTDHARLLFASFPDRLRVAMKTAATRNTWCADTWPLQIELINDALASGRQTDTELTAAYSEVPNA